ncbi:MAG: MotA/TolQ/ExbB proton channel family protein [Planctomycetota bacterium]
MKSVRYAARVAAGVLLVVGLTSPSLFAAEEDRLLGGGIADIVETGGAVMVVILAGSVVGLALALERFVSLRASNLVPKSYADALREAAGRDDVGALGTLAREGKGPLARILEAGFRVGRGDPREMERAMESMGQHEIGRLKRPVRPLAIIATVAPLLGLLGTVLGMITTFNLLGGTSPADRVETLAPGIGKALYTTAAGLCVAIPFVVLYHVLNGRIQRAAAEWGLIGTDVVAACAAAREGGKGAA